jgi:hypothetical protein
MTMNTGMMQTSMWKWHREMTINWYKNRNMKNMLERNRKWTSRKTFHTDEIENGVSLSHDNRWHKLKLIGSIDHQSMQKWTRSEK